MKGRLDCLLSTLVPVTFACLISLPSVGFAASEKPSGQAPQLQCVDGESIEIRQRQAGDTSSFVAVFRDERSQEASIAVVSYENLDLPANFAQLSEQHRRERLYELLAEDMAGLLEGVEETALELTGTTRQITGRELFRVGVELEDVTYDFLYYIETSAAAALIARTVAERKTDITSSARLLIDALDHCNWE